MFNGINNGIVALNHYHDIIHRPVIFLNCFCLNIALQHRQVEAKVTFHADSYKTDTAGLRYYASSLEYSQVQTFPIVFSLETRSLPLITQTHAMYRYGMVRK